MLCTREVEFMEQFSPGQAPGGSEVTSSSELAEGSDYKAAVSFADLPLGQSLQRALAEKGYHSPTPVQAAVLGPILEGRDLIVRSKTGTGKTAAFGLPILERLPEGGAGEVRALCLCPTRELALQVADEIAALGKYKGAKVVAVYGGASMGEQIGALEAGGEIVVGTPGRVYDHLRRKTLSLRKAQFAVLDEADEMLSMGFYEEVTKILDLMPEERQTLLFSATVPQDIKEIARKYLRDPETILLSGDVYTVEGIENVIYYTVDAYPKPRNLLYLVEREEPDNAIIFANTRDDTALVTAVLNRNGYDAELLNGDLPQKERERVMAKVKAGEVRFMVATDIAARGIDISDLTHVINYSLPEDPAVYLHRIGRTGRIGKTGTAISLVGGRELTTLTSLEKRYGIKFSERKLPTPEEAQKLWMDRHVSKLREAALGSIFEAFLPLAQELKRREGGETLIAFCLKYFFHHAQIEQAATKMAEAGQKRVSPPDKRIASPRMDRSRRPEREPHEQRAARIPPRASAAVPAAPAASKDQQRLYLNWGDLDPLPPHELSLALSELSGIPAARLEGVLEVSGRRGFLTLDPVEAERLLQLHGREAGGRALRIEVARDAVRRDKRRRRPR
jgi:ATP-dependent RNA helicase DeaD